MGRADRTDGIGGSGSQFRQSVLGASPASESRARAGCVEAATDAEIRRLIIDLVCELERRSRVVSNSRTLEATGVRAKLLTADDLASRLGVAKARIYALAREGRIDGVVRIGRRLRFEPNALDAWIRQGGYVDAHGPEAEG